MYPVALLALAASPNLPDSTVNLLLTAQLSGNFESFGQGVRGEPRELVYDVGRRSFWNRRSWHEYGVGFERDIGVVPEERAACVQAEWPHPVEANYLALGGAYPNQPQLSTMWRIELRQGGSWTTHASGMGGWISGGTYRWGGHGIRPLRFDGLRVRLYSPDASTPLKSIDLRGEQDESWIVAKLPPFAARFELPTAPVRAGVPARFRAFPVTGRIRSWEWKFFAGGRASGATISKRVLMTGENDFSLTVSDGKESATYRGSVVVQPPLAMELRPLRSPVLAGRPAAFKAFTVAGRPNRIDWDFGDGTSGQGREITHTYGKPGLYRLRLTASDGQFREVRDVTIRVLADASRLVPQVVLDTDAKNEQDDQYYLGYALFSDLDVLAVNSVHNGGGQEETNYEEIRHVFGLARESGLHESRVPPVYRGANLPLRIPDSGRWIDTAPWPTAASNAILSAARGAPAGRPVWIVPVGPATNVASAILEARRMGFDLRGRIRILWLGGLDHTITREYNGDNDPWAAYVMTQSGIETWIMPAPVGARVAVDKRSEGGLFPDHALGRYLKEITPAEAKPLFDPACLSVIIADARGLPWVRSSEFVTVGGPDRGYQWVGSAKPTKVRVIRQIDAVAMRNDLFQTLAGRPTKLRP